MRKRPFSKRKIAKKKVFVIFFFFLSRKKKNAGRKKFVFLEKYPSYTNIK